MVKDRDRKMGIALFEYNQRLKKGLAQGNRYTELLDQMVYTDDKEELLALIEQLVSFPLDSDYVQYPVQYSTADFYLIFMARLLEEHHISSMIQMDMNGTAGNVVQKLTPLDAIDTFHFELDEAGMAYTDTQYHEKLFYMDFQTKQVVFNSDALLDLFIINLKPIAGNDAIVVVINTLMAFANYMHVDYGYKVAYNILATDNEAFYAFKTHALPSETLDQLFIDSSEVGLQLMAYQQSGAKLELDDVQLLIFNQGDQAKANWGIQIKDPNQKVSWFQLLLKYDFLRDWYLTNRTVIESVK